jgi:hypothetical protein
MRNKVFFGRLPLIKVSWKRTQRPFFIGNGGMVGFYYAERGGGPVLKDESSWRKINGVFFNVRPLQIYFAIEFRRFGP